MYDVSHWVILHFFASRILTKQQKQPINNKFKKKVGQNMPDDWINTL